MRLDAWLRQDPPLVERLQAAERLARAVNAAHDRGLLLGGLEPSRVDIASDGECNLDDAMQGTPGAPYRAPEREGSAPTSAAADLYAAGTILWEVLVGRQYAQTPSHLSQARKDLPSDLADAVMACLERSPEWRPRDLSYVAELAQQAATQRGGGRGSRAATPKTSAPARSERTKRPSARPSPQARGGGDGGRLPRILIIVAGLVAVVAGAGYFWAMRGGEGESTAAAPRPAATTVPEPPAAATATPTATPEPVAPAAPAPAPTALLPTVSPAPTPPAVLTPAPRPTPTALSAPVATVARPLTPEPVVAPRPTPTPATTTPAAPPPAAAAAVPTQAAAPSVAAPREPATLSTLSPLSVKRPGRVLFDIHGTGLAADLQARLVAVRDAPRGMSVVRLKCSGTLCSVLVELEDSVKPTAYAILLEDPQGQQTNALTFTVTK
jgi:hypothetical protein